MNRLLKNRVEQAKKHQSKSGKFFAPSTFIFMLHPVMRTTHWLLVFIIASFASLKSKEIADITWPFSDSAGDLNWWAIAFWISIAIVTIMFALHDWVKRAQDNYAIDSMLTMPPRDFWLSYGRNYAELAKQNDINIFLLGATEIESKEEDDPDFLRDAIENAKREVRIGLDQIIRLGYRWDASNLDNASVTYRANIMRAYYLDGESDDDTTLIVGSERYNEIAGYAEKFSMRNPQNCYSGFVVLEDNQYTTTTETTEPLPDQERKPIAFPFTLKSDNRKGVVKYNHPGASVAVANGAPSYVPDVKELAEQYLKQENVANRVVEDRIYENLESYYRENSVAHSMLSVPLVDTEHRIRYVLNVYRDQPELLFAGGKVADFSEIIWPYASVLENMMFVIDSYERVLATLENAPA